jgi:DNA-binding NtrC family response regulator
LNGVESFIEMKKNNPDINVILASAYSLEELIRKAVDEGARAVMSKPLNFGDLFDTLRDIISKKEGGIVLIADDDKALSENLEEILVKEGYQVVIAHDGEDVLRKIDNVAFDIALIDMKFPFLNGLEVYRRIKLTQPSIVAILISGYAVEMGALIEQALSEDARTFLTKPINIEKLLNTLKEIQA